MKWWQWLRWNPAATRVVLMADATLEANHIRYLCWSEQDKHRTTALMVELLHRVIPGYRLDFGFHTQFIAFILKQDRAALTNLAKELNTVARGADGHDEPLRMAFDCLKAFVAMFALDTRSAYTFRVRGQVYGERSRSMNDLVQAYLAVKLNDMIARYEPA